MSVASSTQHFSIDPIQGQDLIMRFYGSSFVVGDASGGNALVSINIPAANLQRPFWVLTDIHPTADNSGAGDCAIAIQPNDPIVGGVGYAKSWYADLAGAAMGFAGLQMLPRLENYPRRFTAFPWRYSKNDLTSPFVSVQFANGLFTFRLSIEGYFMDERVIPKLIPVFPLM